MSNMEELDRRIAEFKKQLIDDGLLRKDWAAWDAEHERGGSWASRADTTGMGPKEGQKATTAGVRSDIKEAGINARVSMQPGGDGIRVDTPTYEAQFSHDEQKMIGRIADAHGLAAVRGQGIDTTHDVHGHGFTLHSGYDTSKNNV